MNEIEKLSNNSCVRMPFNGFGALLVMLPALLFAGCSTSQLSDADTAQPQERAASVAAPASVADDEAKPVRFAEVKAQAAAELQVQPPVQLPDDPAARPAAQSPEEPASVNGSPPAVVEQEVSSPLQPDGPTAVDSLAGEGGAAAVAAPEAPSPLGFDIPRREEVTDVIAEFSKGNRRAIIRGLARAMRYRDYISKVLEQKELPQGLYILPMVESSFRTDAYSQAGAAGMWQFIDSTARLSGLRVDWWVDERLDWRASTRAAVDHLKELYDRFGDWELSLAAYNAGPGGVGRAIAKGGADFWALCKKKLLRAETRRYVPKFYALMDIFSHPESYGFEPAPSQVAEGIDEVRVDSPVALHTVSRIAGVSEKALKELNPALLRGCTPPGTAEYFLKVPLGKGELVAAELAKLGAVERLDFKRHRVAAGDTLWKIAKKYSTRVKAIAELNRLSNPRMIRPGAQLVVPVRKGFASRATRATVSFEGRKVHVVQGGDSLWGISRKYGVAVAQLLAWNRLSNNSTIFAGSKLLVSPANTSSLALAHDAVHVVASGDTLWSISRNRGVTVDQLRRWNRLGGSTILQPGDKLRVTPVAD